MSLKIIGINCILCDKTHTESLRSFCGFLDPTLSEHRAVHWCHYPISMLSSVSQGPETYKLYFLEPLRHCQREPLAQYSQGRAISLPLWQWQVHKWALQTETFATACKAPSYVLEATGVITGGIWQSFNSKKARSTSESHSHFLSHLSLALLGLRSITFLGMKSSYLRYPEWFLSSSLLDLVREIIPITTCAFNSNLKCWLPWIEYPRTVA